jgi:hypothetical protein
MHAGIAPELAKALAAARRETTTSGPGGGPRRRSSRRPKATAGHISTRSFEQLLSIAGAGGLLSIALLGPVGIIVLAIMVAIAIVVTARPRRGAGRPRVVSAEVWRPGRHRAQVAPGPPEASDPWRLWRIVEADREYLQRGAA